MRQFVQRSLNDLLCPFLQLGASFEVSLSLTLPSPSESAQLALFAPYCGGRSREGELQQALRLLAQGSLSGLRPVKQTAGHGFNFTWQGARSPLEMSSCQLSFPESPAVRYAFDVETHQLVEWLMDWDEQAGPGDLPDNFWTWLLLGEAEIKQDA